MKKNVIILSLLFTCLAFTAEAKVWRLNNQPGINADFTTTLQDAINGVLSGDTIYVEQSPFNYGDLGRDVTEALQGTTLIPTGGWFDDDTYMKQLTTYINKLPN